MSNEQDPSKQGQQGTGDGATGGAGVSAGSGAAGGQQYLTPEMFSAMLKEHLNPAITNHLSRFEKKMETRLAALTPAQQKAAEGDAAAEGGDGGPAEGGTAAQQVAKAAADKQADPEVEQLKKALAKLEAKAIKAEQTAAAERRQRIEDAGYETVRSALRGKVVAGVEDDLLDAWRARKQVVIGDDGSTRLRLSLPDEPEEGLDVQAAIAAFLKTEKAKLYLPPPNGAGARVAARPSLSGQGAPAKGATPATAFEQKYGKSLTDALRGG